MENATALKTVCLPHHPKFMSNNNIQTTPLLPPLNTNKDTKQIQMPCPNKKNASVYLSSQNGDTCPSDNSLTSKKQIIKSNIKFSFSQNEEEAQQTSNNNCVYNVHPPSRTNRVIVNTSKWIFSSIDLEHACQLQMIDELIHASSSSSSSLCNNTNNAKDSNHHTKKLQLCKTHVKIKISSYKMQDIKKAMYEDTKFVTYEYVLHKLKEKQLKCFYCHNSVYVLYERVRDPKQWTIERIDNHYGHNVDNVEIACLTCNIRRNTIYIERYVDTKNICNGVVKLLGSDCL